MKVIFSKYALLEMEDAVRFYNRELEGLGIRFKKDIKKAIKRIVNYPQAWSVERGDIRKYILHKFPYKLLYSLEKDHVLIIAVAHLHRNPEYWIEREGT